MSMQDIRNREVIKEYYMFLYDLASRKNYEHSSQLTDEEREYCKRLLSKNKSQNNEDGMTCLSLMEDMFKELIIRKKYAERQHHDV